MSKVNKKGEGLAMEVIIIAALLVGVVIVVLAIFSGRISLFSKDISSCTIKGGFCASSCNEDKNYYSMKANCPEKGDSRNFRVCCIPIKGQRQNG